MASPMPLLSVALCTWNGARWLRPQLDSILAQEDVRLELVALDDASTDDSLAILHEYAARDPRIRVHANATNLGHLCSFEKCMSMGEGDFIAPADQDDVWHPYKLRTLLDAIGDADLAYGDSRYVDADGQPSGRRVSDDMVMASGRGTLPLLLQNTVSGHAALLRRNLLDRACPFPDGVFHDGWLAMLAAHGAGIVYVDEVLVDFRRHADASSAVGKSRGDGPRPSRAQREAEWLRERAWLAGKIAERIDSPLMAAWSTQLQALQQGRSAGLLQRCLQDRHALARAGTSTWREALRCHLSLSNKARRIRRGAGDSTAPE